jgi:pre-rRNA-processing protein TSR3
MDPFPKTIILRHRKERLKKCSLYGLENRDDLQFYSYPWTREQPDLTEYVVLALDAPLLTHNDADKGIFLIDGTWRYAKKMLLSLEKTTTFRRLPPSPTAYPRNQEVENGLASIEALYLAYQILERDPEGLLDHYYWKEEFIQRLKKH